MKAKSKKVISILLTLCVMISMIPASVFAATTGGITEDEGQLIIPFQKNWDDSENAQEFRPEAISVSLYRYSSDEFDKNSAELIETISVTEEDSWYCTFDISELKIFDDNGNTFKYKVVEEAVENYEESAHKDPTVVFRPPSAENGWNRITPCSELQIQSAGDNKSVVLAKKGNDYIIWTVDALTPAEREIIFDSAKANINGFGQGNFANATFISGFGTTSEFGMTVTSYEITFGDPSDWSFFATGLYNKSSTEANAASITNKYVPQETSVSVTKEWNDADNQDGIRPATVNVILTGKVGNDVVSTNSVELGKDGNWSHVFENLPVKSGGQDIVYSVIEDKVPEGYSASYDGNIEDGFTITNTHTPEKIDVSGSKEWNDKGDQDGKRPESITVYLMANGEKVASKEVTADDNWSWTFEDVYKFKDGQKITYTFTEESVADYSVDYNKANTIINSYTPQQTSVSVTKAWEDDSNRDGIRPESVTVKLLADGKPTGKTLELSEDNQWTGAFTELDMYKNHGTLIKYTVEEKDTASGYEPSIVKAENGNIFTITNTHTPERISVSGTKTWNDAGNQDGIRPESITVNLMANGEKVASKEVTADDNWSWTFDNQYKFENGKEIVYSVTEDPIDGYTCKVDGMNITNTHEPELTQITIGKTWVGDNAASRPYTIKVNVFADGMYLTTVDVTAQGNWTYTLTDLPKYKAGEVGKEIVYTISEKEVPGYKSSVDGYEITNTWVPEEVPPTDDKTPSTGDKVTQTDDDFNTALYMMLMLLALTGIGASVIRRKRVN